MSQKLLKKLIEFNKIRNNLVLFEKKLNKSIENILNLNSINNSVINEIKVCKIDIKLIQIKQNNNQFNCFWPKCHFKTNHKERLERH